MNTSFISAGRVLKPICALALAGAVVVLEIFILTVAVRLLPSRTIEVKNVPVVIRPVKLLEVETTAYSEFDSCHFPGCVMSSGKPAYVGAVACPRSWKIGTKIYIEGHGVFVCEDRTAKRFDGRIDIFQGYGQAGYEKAIEWGIRRLKVGVYVI